MKVHFLGLQGPSTEAVGATKFKTEGKLVALTKSKTEGKKQENIITVPLPDFAVK